MKHPALVRRPQAARDIEEIAAWHAQTGGVALELKFIDALESTFELLLTHPQAGSTRHADLFPELPARLRFHPLPRFKRVLVYYLGSPDRVEVVRVWDAARGLDALFGDDEQE